MCFKSTTYGATLICKIAMLKFFENLTQNPADCHFMKRQIKKFLDFGTTILQITSDLIIVFKQRLILPLI